MLINLGFLSINDAVNGCMGDMNTLGPGFSRERLGHCTDSGLAHGKHREFIASFKYSCCIDYTKSKKSFIN